jgi:hypothetical protein
MIALPVSNRAITGLHPFARACRIEPLSSKTFMSSKQLTSLNPRTTSYEFLGPPGAFFITLAVPTVTYALYFACSEQSGGCLPTSLAVFPVVRALTSLAWWTSLWDTKASLIYVSWYFFCVLSWHLLPGDWVEGVALRTGQKLKYKINGMHGLHTPVIGSLHLYSFLDISASVGSDLRDNFALRSSIFHLVL